MCNKASMMAAAPNPSSVLLDQLPDELLTHICAELSDPRDLLRLSQASKKSRRIALSAPSWQDIYLSWWQEEREGGEQTLRSKTRKRKLREWVRREDEWRRETTGEGSNATSSSSSSNAGATCRSLYSIDHILAVPDEPLTAPASERANVYYDICRQRLNVETRFLRRARHHLQLKHGQLISALDILRESGPHIRHFLQLLAWDQSLTSTPSGLREFVQHDSSGGEGEEWPTTCKLHLRAIKGTPLPHRSSHLALCELASSLLAHLQRRSALETCRQIRQHDFEDNLKRAADEDAQTTGTDQVPRDGRTLREVCQESSAQVEEALIAVSQFRGGEKTAILEYLDLLAVYIYMKLRAHSEPLQTTRQVVSVIWQHLHDLSFAPAHPIDFLDLDNSFLHISLFCPHNRTTLPLTLMTIFVSISTRLGIAAGISNVPGRIIAVAVEANPDSTESDFFFVDGSRLPDSPVCEPSQSVEWAAMIGMTGGATFQSLDWSPATGAAIMRRSGQNILNAVQNAQAGPRIFHVSRGSREAGGGDSADTQKDAEGRLRRQQPRPLHILKAYLSKHPDSTHQGDQLPPELCPVPSTTAYQLPKSRANSLDQEASHDATYCAAWVLTELAYPALGEAGIKWILDHIHTRNTLDVALTMHGQRAFKKAARKQRMLAHARRRQGGAIGVYGDDEDEVNILPIGGNGGNGDDGDSDDDDDGDGDSSDDSAAGSSRAASPSPFPSLSAPSYASETDDSRWFKRHVPDVFAEDLSLPTRSEHLSPSRPPKVLHTVGTLFEHRSYGYRAVVTGWDPECAAGDAWIRQMGVDNLPADGRRQPFYHARVEDGTTRYVAQCNIRSIRVDDGATTTTTTRPNVLDDFAKLFQARGVGGDFCALDARRLRLKKGPKMHARWGSEGSDDDDDGGSDGDKKGDEEQGMST